MRNVLVLFALTPALLFTRCYREPSPTCESGGAPPAADSCQRGYDAAEFVCPESLPSNWADICRNAEEVGIDMRPDCLEEALSCTDIERCQNE